VLFSIQLQFLKGWGYHRSLHINWGLLFLTRTVLGQWSTDVAVCGTGCTAVCAFFTTFLLSSRPYLPRKIASAEFVLGVGAVERHCSGLTHSTVVMVSKWYGGQNAHLFCRKFFLVFYAFAASFRFLAIPK
jgi:hypothetical protein